MEEEEEEEEEKKEKERKKKVSRLKLHGPTAPLPQMPSWCYCLVKDGEDFIFSCAFSFTFTIFSNALLFNLFFCTVTVVALKYPSATVLAALMCLKIQGAHMSSNYTKVLSPPVVSPRTSGSRSKVIK